MKTQFYFKIVFLLIIIFILGCGRNYKVETIIYADGSCHRTFIVTDHEKIEDFFKSEYPIPVDTTWNLVIEKDTVEGGDTIYIYKATKFFENVEQLNQLYVTDTSIYSCTGRTVELKRKFRWFYTYLEYIETYPKLFNQTSLVSYMDSVQYSYTKLTHEEQQKYLKENFDSLGAERFDEEIETIYFNWMARSIFNELFDVVEKSAKNISNWPISDSDFKHKRDSLQIIMDTNEDKDIWDILNVIVDFDSTLISNLRQQKAFSEFEIKYRFFEDIFLESGYSNTIEMPGLIIETNSSRVSEYNKVEWYVEWDKYFTDDYKMYVQSRIINKWAFWVSGIFVIFFIVVVALKKLRKT